MAQGLLGEVGWRVKGLRIWIDMYFLIRKLTSFEDLAYGPKPWGGGWAGIQKSMDLGRYIFLMRKLSSFERSCLWPKALGGGAGGSKVHGFGQACIF